jgi:hypothetical protein
VAVKTFYHRTTETVWEGIQADGSLHGAHPGGSRYTYLSPSRDIDESYGPVLLEVEYEPVGAKGTDNYGFDPPPGQECWQFSVFIPIPLSRVRRIE